VELVGLDRSLSRSLVAARSAGPIEFEMGALIYRAMRGGPPVATSSPLTPCLFSSLLILWLRLFGAQSDKRKLRGALT